MRAAWSSNIFPMTFCNNLPRKLILFAIDSCMMLANKLYKMKIKQARRNVEYYVIHNTQFCIDSRSYGVEEVNARGIISVSFTAENELRRGPHGALPGANAANGADYRIKK